jgi:putative transposase
MPRPLRLEHAGVWYHITARGNARQRIFWDQRDRLHPCELLEEAVTRFRLRLFA